MEAKSALLEQGKKRSSYLKWFFLSNERWDFISCVWLSMHTLKYLCNQEISRFFSRMSWQDDQKGPDPARCWAERVSGLIYVSQLPCACCLREPVCGDLSKMQTYTQDLLPADMKTTFIITVASSVHLSILGESRVIQLSLQGYFEFCHSSDGYMRPLHLPNHGGKAGIVY